jgi:hypothetical protein
LNLYCCTRPHWENRSAKAVTVRLKISGFYDLIPAGETGNKAGIVPSAAGPVE